MGVQYKDPKVGAWIMLRTKILSLGRPGAGLMVKGTTIQDYDEELVYKRHLDPQNRLIIGLEMLKQDLLKHLMKSK